jgi:hypothetical protein
MCASASSLRVLGHAWKRGQWNILKTGRVLVMIDGERHELRAPRALYGGPGRKVAFVVEDTVWCNVIATDAETVDEVEGEMVVKSSAALMAAEVRACLS